MTKFASQTRIIKVTHPTFKDKVLFEAHVKVVNINKDLVEKITKVNIQYELKNN
jgi:hypothetical protein